MVVPSFWRDRVTVFSRGLDGWTSVKLDGCLFRKVGRVQVGGGMKGDGSGYVVRIPDSAGFVLKVGDVVVDGWVDDEVSDGGSGNVLLERYKGRAFAVVECVESRGMPHAGHWLGKG